MIGKYSNGISGWMTADFPDMDADYLFDELRDLPGQAEAIEDMLSFELYDRSFKVSKNERGEFKPRPLPKHFQVEQPSADKACRLLAQGGHCYVQMRNFCGKQIQISTSVTRVDASFDERTNKRSWMTCCHNGGDIFYATTTYVVERLSQADTALAADNDKLADDNDATESTSPSSSSSSTFLFGWR